MSNHLLFSSCHHHSPHWQSLLNYHKFKCICHWMESNHKCKQYSRLLNLGSPYIEYQYKEINRKALLSNLKHNPWHIMCNRCPMNHSECILEWLLNIGGKKNLINSFQLNRYHKLKLTGMMHMEGGMEPHQKSHYRNSHSLEYTVYH